jgi:predicted GIY-YIG superfamily endonuclease
MIHPGKGDETAVYRLYDADGRLLYVGISRDPVVRWGQHQGKRWWPKVATYAVDWHVDRESAAVAETEAIRQEKPSHNCRTDTVKHTVNTAAGWGIHKEHRERLSAQLDEAFAVGIGTEEGQRLRAAAHAEFNEARRAYLARSKRR